jgi:hypothetical protein
MSDLFDNLHDIFVVEDVIFSNSLGLMFHRRSPDKSTISKERKSVRFSYETDGTIDN